MLDCYIGQFFTQFYFLQALVNAPGFVYTVSHKTSHSVGFLFSRRNSLHLPFVDVFSFYALFQFCSFIVTHISHIETGNSIPSIQVLVDIINTLHCSADELLCIDIEKDRPIVSGWISDLLSDCSADEVKLITDTILALKNSLRRLSLFENKA